MQNKRKLLDHLILTLEGHYEAALTAAKKAHSTATDKANVAENKYDTLGLEASYLAQGQANRAAEYKAELAMLKNLNACEYTSDDAIGVGAHVSLVDQYDKQLVVFLVPVSGGMKFEFAGQTIMVITPASPLGQQLLGKCVDDDITIGNGSHQNTYYISAIG